MKNSIYIDTLFNTYTSNDLDECTRKQARHNLLRILRYHALRGDSESQYFLGLVYADDSCKDVGIKPKLKKALYWYTLSSENNNPYACHNLAYFFEEGIVAPKNEAKEISLYEKAFKLGLSESGYALYILHLQRGRNKEAIQWLKNTIKLDPKNGDALVEYAKACFEGRLTLRSYQKAHEYALKAIESKNLTRFAYEEALFLIGVMYFEGLFLKQDLTFGKHLIMFANKDNDHPEISEYVSKNKLQLNKIKMNGAIQIPNNLAF